MKIIPYINFTGNAEEAMNFYEEVFGGEIEIQRWGEMPPNPEMPVSDDWQNKIMHGSLTIREDVTIYLSDFWEEGEETCSHNVSLHVEFDSEDELRKAFDALSVGGTVNMPVDKTFWGAIYGDLIDRFGIGWGLHYQLPE
jgi:PhnB protein